MKRAIDIGPVDAAAIKTVGGKVRLRLLFTVEQLAALLEAAAEGAEEDQDTDPAMKRNVTQCNAPESEERREEDDADARASPHVERSQWVFVIEGTRAWTAWMAHRLRIEGRKTCPTYTRTIDGKRRTGWDFPTLFPLTAATGPPKPISEQDVREVSNNS